MAESKDGDVRRSSRLADKKDNDVSKNNDSSPTKKRQRNKPSESSTNGDGKDVDTQQQRDATEPPAKKARSDEDKGKAPAKEEEEERQQPSSRTVDDKDEQRHAHLAKDEDLHPDRLLHRTATSSTSTTKTTTSAKITERGKLFFFYRPRVTTGGEAHDWSDVQRLYLLLTPIDIEDTNATKTPAASERLVNRLLVVGRKKMPSTGSHERFWAFVDKASDDIKQIDAILGKDKYETETQGDRTVAACRPAGEGYYGIINHHGHTHLAYILEQPTDIGEVQQAFNIQSEACYVISIKNPQTDDGGFTGVDQKAQYPAAMQDAFSGRRWLPVCSPSYLDYDGTEMVIIGTSDDLVDEFGKVGEQLEEEERKDAGQGDEASSARKVTSRMFEELKMPRAQQKDMPTEALTEGTFV